LADVPTRQRKLEENRKIQRKRRKIRRENEEKNFDYGLGSGGWNDVPRIGTGKRESRE